MDERRRASALRRQARESGLGNRASERRQSNQARTRYGSFSVTRADNPAASVPADCRMTSAVALRMGLLAGAGES